MKKIVAVSLFFLSAAKVMASSCWEEAGKQYSVDPLLLKAIAWNESRGFPNAVGPLLKDGNRALGLMQINTVHLPALRKQGFDRDDLFKPCVSVLVGAWVLRDCMSKFGETWRAVGCYAAGPESNAIDAQVKYVLKVQEYYRGYQRQASLENREIALRQN